MEIWKHLGPHVNDFAIHNKFQDKIKIGLKQHEMKG